MAGLMYPGGSGKVISWFVETINVGENSAAIKLYYYENFELKDSRTYSYASGTLLNFHGLKVYYSDGKFRFSCDYSTYYVSSVSHSLGGLNSGSFPAFDYYLWRYMIVIKRGD